MNPKQKVEFYKHNIGATEKQAVQDCLDGVFLTTGQIVKDFESELSDYLRIKRSVGLTSCTAALHLSLLALGIGEGDEVITTPLTFIATASAILYTGAKPVFADVEPQTGLLDSNDIEKAITEKTKAILPVHLYGQMCDMKRIRKIADRYELAVVEDCAHCIEGERDGVKPGELSDAACFSFYATKNITCGEGGAVATRRDDIADAVTVLRSHGMTKQAADRYEGRYQHWDMTRLGWKYNMSNIQAALLRNQLKNIDVYWQRRETISQMYEEGFKSNDAVQVMKVLPESKSARHLFTILVDPKERDRVLWQLQEKGIGVAVNYRAIHLLDFYCKKLNHSEGDFSTAEDIGDQTVTLPLYAALKDDEVQYVIECVNEVTQS